MSPSRLLLLLLSGLAPLHGAAQDALPAASVTAAAGPLTLEQCVRLAVARNVSAQRADLNTATSRSTWQQSRANRLPSLNSTTSYNYSSGRNIDPGTNQFVDKPVGSLNTSLSSSLTLFNGGQIRQTIRQNARELAATELDAETARRTLALQVLEAYVAVLQAQEQLQTARTQRAETAAQLVRTRELAAAGSVAGNNVLQVRAQLASDDLTVTTAENTLATNRLALLQLMEEPADRPELVLAPPAALADPDTATAPPAAEALYAAALLTQPQIRAYGLRSESAALGVRAAQAQRLPKLVLTGSLNTMYSTARSRYTTQTVQQQQVVGFLQNDQAMPVYATVPVTTVTAGTYALSGQLRDNFTPTIGLSLSVPVFNNWQARRTVQRAQIAVAAAALDERNARNQLRKTVEQARLDLLTARRRYAAARDQLHYQEQAYRNLEVKYRLEATTAQDLLIEKNKLAKARADWTQARYEVVLRTQTVAFYQQDGLSY